jgi:hypothetical protein
MSIKEKTLLVTLNLYGVIESCSSRNTTPVSDQASYLLLDHY